MLRRRHQNEMKIDKRRPGHWLLLFLFFLQGVTGLLLRRMIRGFIRRKSGIVVLYGHKLNGNLLPLYREMDSPHASALTPVFLTMDLAYCRLLRADGLRAEWACGPRCAALLSQASALVSDHGLHALQPLHRAFRHAGLLFFDVWHGIPFKGFDGDDFRLQHQYDEIWVASDLHRNLYIDKFGFDAERVVVTGYARTDCLVTNRKGHAEIRRRLGLPSEEKLILFAPTWGQDAEGRSVFPFGESAQSFLESLSALALRWGGKVLLRTHLNSSGMLIPDLQGVVPFPSDQYPNTEEILQISDALICDWSSIAFDYLLLGRPTFFLDVPPPFRKGLALGEHYRFGPIVGGLEYLLVQLEMWLEAPSEYWKSHRSLQSDIKNAVYGPMADGRASVRCVDRLLHHIGNLGG